jgi:pyrimidine operon attenuation protein / uracil phosphoribosyltransferase
MWKSPGYQQLSNHNQTHFNKKAIFASMQRIILDSTQFEITIKRLCFQLIEIHESFSDTVIIGIQPRGAFLADRIVQHLKEITGIEIVSGKLDVTFYRDDFRRREIQSPSRSTINFIVENKKVVLIDDVFFTGRTIRAAMDALIDFGRPEKVELLALIDRRYNRHLPIAPDYTGVQVDTIASEKIRVHWKESDGYDGVELISVLNAEK